MLLMSMAKPCFGMMFISLALLLFCQLAAYANEQPPHEAFVGPNINYRWAYANPKYVKDKYHAPAPVSLQYTHMGMLNLLPNSSLAAAWQGAKVFWEGSNGQGIYWAVSHESGLSWERPQLLVPAAAGVPIWAPVLHVQDGTIWLFYSESRPQCWWWGEGGLHWACGGDLKKIYSLDGGLSWTKPQVVFAFDSEGGIAKMVANKLALGPSGEWLLPFWREMGGNDCTHAPDMHGKAGVLISEDQGNTWERVDVKLQESSEPTWLIEASISGTMFAGEVSYVQVFRTQAGLIYRSTSKDGREWTPAAPTSLPNPNSKVDMTTLSDGTLLLAYNNDAAKRSSLSLAISIDAGTTWNRVAVLEDDPEGSFSYPTLQYLSSKGLVLVIYSVAYPPKPSLVGQQAWVPLDAVLQRCMRALETARRWLLHSTGLEGWWEVGQAPVEWWERDRHPANAWGYDAYGLRVAILHASDLMSRRQDIHT